jgi:hypothetical protein
MPVCDVTPRSTRKLIGPTAGPDFRPDASTDTVARRPKNQLAKLYEYKSERAKVSTLTSGFSDRHASKQIQTRPRYLSRSGVGKILQYEKLCSDSRTGAKKPADRVYPDQPTLVLGWRRTLDDRKSGDFQAAFTNTYHVPRPPKGTRSAIGRFARLFVKFPLV